MIVSRLVSKGWIFSDDVLGLSIGTKTKKFWWPLSPVKYILPNKKSYPFYDIYATLFVKSVIFYSTYSCFVLFEVTIWLKFFSLSSKYVPFAKSAISTLDVTCLNVMLALILP